MNVSIDRQSKAASACRTLAGSAAGKPAAAELFENLSVMPRFFLVEQGPARNIGPGSQGVIAASW